MPTATEMTFPNINGSVTLSTEGGGTKVTEYDGYELHGTYTEKVWEENDPEIGKAYVYNDNGELTAVTAETKIRPTECYILKTKTRMTDMGITITIPSQTWTGNELTPVITVKDGETVLTENTDYTVTAPSGPVEDSGNHAYTITGMGNYAGSREATFTISPYLADQFGAVYVYQDQNGKTALLEGTSVEPVDIPSVINKTVNHVTNNRVFTPGVASTVMLPFNYTCSGEEGGTFYKFVGVKKENDKWVATMQETGNDANNEGTDCQHAVSVYAYSDRNDVPQY